MSLIEVPLPDSGPPVTALQNALSTLGFAIPNNERGTTPDSGVFGPGTRAAVEGFRADWRLPPIAPTESPFDAVAARLLNVVVPGQGTNMAVLSAAVRESIAAAQGTDAFEAEYLARFATIARDFRAARQALELAPDNKALSALVGPIVGDATFQSPHPELQCPENQYACQFDFVPPDALKDICSGGEIRIYAHRRQPEPSGSSSVWPQVPPDIGELPPPPPEQTAPARLHALHAAADNWVRAVDLWQKGHREFNAQRYGNAVASYSQAQEAAAAYFESFYGIQADGGIGDRLQVIIEHLAKSEAGFFELWAAIRRRRTALTLTELQQLDWSGYSYADGGADALLRKNLRAPTDPDQQQDPGKAEDKDAEVLTRQRVLDRFALLLAVVFAPLARADANRMRRFFADAEADLQRVQFPFRIPDPIHGAGTGGGGGGTLPLAPPAPPGPEVGLVARGRPVWLICDFIEPPFARLALAETLFDQAEAAYRSDAPADPDLPALPEVDGEKLDDWPRQGFEFSTHGLGAAQVYRQVLDMYAGVGGYAERVLNGRDLLAQGAGNPQAPDFHVVAKTVTLPASGTGAATVTSTTASLPGLQRSKAPAEPWLRLAAEADGEPLSDTNPRVYALLLSAQARLEQIKHNFNYLGYPDDYVPPWRLQFLLERARYFAEHAKSTERDYLNFLANAEHEEYQELSASQNVELEKANVRIETARVEQAESEVVTAGAAANLAGLHADNAELAAGEYKDFSDEVETSELVGSLFSEVFDLGTENFSAAINEGVGLVKSWVGLDVKQAQREVELHNLQRAATEARLAKREADARLQTAQAGLVVAGLQRQAALLRHELALQNLTYLRTRRLSAEQWLRLANAIRGVSDTYLRYALQLAFLAEQAYEFEADKRINVIRFDYDLSDVGSFLAADFLLRDLDTIEQDRVVTQQQRQQEVRYVLSLAREFPQALQDLRDNGRVGFTLPLEQIERRFPGLYNARIGSVEVLPVALLDPNRYSVQLRHLGFGQLRLKAKPDTAPGQPSTSVLNTNDVPIPPDGWLPHLVEDWPIKIRVSEPQTNLYSGLTRTDAAAAFPIATSGQRNAFEGLPAASAWTIDLTSTQQAIVPGTLADVLVTFALFGYHDQDLAAAVDSAPSRPLATTSSLSARSLFPDAFYSLVNEGTAAFDVSDAMLSASGGVGALRNLAVLLALNPRGAELGRCCSRYDLTLEIPATGDHLQVLDALPDLTLTPAGLALDCAYNGPTDTHVTWDFGDGSPTSQERSVQHRYGKAGHYDLRIQLARHGRLSEYRATAVVSEHHPVTPPLVAVPQITIGTADPAAGTVDLRVSLPAGPSDVGLDCAIGQRRASSTTGSLVLPGIARGGRVALRLLAMRPLSARLYSRQRYLPDQPVTLTRLRAASNRTFSNGVETTTLPNPLTTYLFGADPAHSVLSPVDRWMLELPLADNPCFLSVSSADIAEFDGREIADAVLNLEFEPSGG